MGGECECEVHGIGEGGEGGEGGEEEESGGV